MARGKHTTRIGLLLAAAIAVFTAPGSLGPAYADPAPGSTSPPPGQPIVAVVEGPDPQLPDGGGTPLCGDTVYVVAVQYTHLPAEAGGLINGADFKVVGVDLKRWLTKTGHGILDVWVVDYKGTHHKGEFNAAGQGGARTEVLHGAYNPVDPLSHDIIVHAYIVKNGTTKCHTRITIQAQGTGGAV
jgi:hypothetical protein